MRGDREEPVHEVAPPPRYVNGGTNAEDLTALAFDRRAAHVRALFERLSPLERARHTDAAVLREVVVGSRTRLTTLSADGLEERRRELAFLESVVDLIVMACRDREVAPRELIQSLLDWTEELIAVSRFADAAETCETALAAGGRAYPEIWPWIQLRKAQAQRLAGSIDAAHATLLETCLRSDRIADRRAVPALLEALGTSSLETGRARLFHQLALARLRVFHTDAGERRAVVGLIRRVHRGVWRLLTSADLPVTDKLLWLTHRLCLGLASAAPFSAGRRAFETLSAGAAYVQQYRGRPGQPARAFGSAGVIDATLVTRAMGGIGDFLMMTPGLRALKAARPDRPIVFAIPRRFFPLFAGNDDVELADIDDDFDPNVHAEWFNLTDCPAARHESRTAPAVRLNRIEIFARALGVTGSRLAAMDRRPRYVVSAAERRWRDEFLRSHTLPDRRTVGVQARTDEPYRDVPHMRQIVEALALDANVIVFGALQPPRPSIPGVIEASSLDTRRAFALAAGCDVLVTPDSAFFHLAGALEIPCVGLFGPTDGRVRGADYPHARIVDARSTLACVPCWRNDATPCGLTGLRRSACLSEIDPAAVALAVRQIATRPAAPLPPAD